jgi:ferritin
MLTKQIEAMINEAVQAELYASHLYRYLANQMQRLGYFGAQKFFQSEASDELEHYQKLADLLNDMGSVAKTPMLEAITDKVLTLRDAIQTAFETEMQLGSDYERWFKGASEAPMVQQALLFFLEQQRKSSGEYRDWLTRLDRAGQNESAILLIDQELGA